MSLCRSAQRTYAGLSAGRVLERVPVEEPAGVLEGDLVDLLLGAAGVLELAPEQLRRLRPGGVGVRVVALPGDEVDPDLVAELEARRIGDEARQDLLAEHVGGELALAEAVADPGLVLEVRSEEHTSELQSLMRISYAVFCLKKKT